MDSLTQLTLGAAIGEAVLGRKVGGKAAAWGAFAGTLPDLDILAYPFLNEMQELAFHRGISHSILFCCVVGPLLGWLVARLHRREGVPWTRWTWLFFLALITHPLIDSLTVYGTQLFQPFSDYPVLFSSVFIIDPLYTGPLLAGIVAALFLRRNRRARFWANTLGLALSSAYLLWSVGVKLHVEAVMQEALATQEIAYDQLLTGPTAFNTLLWYGLADDGDTLSVALYSIFDDAPPTAFRRLPKHAEKLDGTRDTEAVQRLLWFSRGYFTITDRNGDRYFNDLRFTRTDAWLGDDGQYIFQFRLLADPDAPHRIIDFRQEQPAIDPSSLDWRALWRRMWGHR